MSSKLPSFLTRPSTHSSLLHAEDSLLLPTDAYISNVRRQVATLGRPWHRKICFIVGNGFSIGLHRAAGDRAREWDPSTPLSWRIRVPTAHGERDLIELTRGVAKEIREHKAREPTVREMDVLAAVVDEYRRREGMWHPLLDDLRHFLINAYSHYQWAMFQHARGVEWDWASWL